MARMDTGSWQCLCGEASGTRVFSRPEPGDCYGAIVCRTYIFWPIYGTAPTA
jgi:hypothetical protein